VTRWLERWYPRLGFLAALGASTVGFRHHPYPPGSADVLRVTVTAASMGLGFLMATTSILISQSQKWIIRRMREEGAFELVISYLVSACRWSLILSASSVLSLFSSAGPAAWWHGYAFAGWVALAVGTGLSIYRIIDLLADILRSMTNQEHPE
jgi:hypothetical protein